MATDASGVAPLGERLQALHPPLMVLEATGGLARLVTSALATGGLPVVVVHPRQARDLARATGPWATTEALEARALAPVADGRRPTPRPLPDAQTPERRGLRGRRQPLLGMRTAAQHRVAGTTECLQADSAAHSAGLNARLALRDDARETLRRARPRWRANDALLPSAPGMGPVCARTWLWALPALGTRTRQQSAALGGVAPLTRARGPRRGRRRGWGGRAPVRTGLSMGTRVATRSNPRSKAWYARFLAAGQVKQVALTACRRQW